MRPTSLPETSENTVPFTIKNVPKFKADFMVEGKAHSDQSYALWPGRKQGNYVYVSLCSFLQMVSNDFEIYVGKLI